MQVETVKIVHNGKRGFKNINKSDFKKGKHKMYSDEQKKTPKELLIEEAKSLGINTDDMTSVQLKDAIKESKDDNN